MKEFNFLLYKLYLNQAVKNSLLKKEKESERKKLRFGVLIIALFMYIQFNIF